MMFFIIFLICIFVLYLWMITPNLFRRAALKKFNHTEFAHRGLHSGDFHVPENSMAAFRAALLRGLGIELDVHLTKDGRIVVFHDDTLKRMCGLDKYIEDMTYTELISLPLLGSSERIPLLEDVLSLVDGKVPLLIEVKLPRKSLAVCRALQKELASYKGEYLIQSFNTLVLYWFRKNAPDILRGQLSANLIREDKSTPYILRLFVQFLLTNFLGKPDFISYSLKDTSNISFLINRHIFRAPTAVWTLTTKKALDKGRKLHNMVIFERIHENY